MRKNEDIKDFPHPLNVELEEEVPVQKKEFDPATGKVSVVTKMEKLTVKYLHAPHQKYRCKDGTHVFRVVSKSKYIFSCKKCRYSRQIYPTTYTITPEGHMIHKATGERV